LLTREASLVHDGGSGERGWGGGSIPDGQGKGGGSRGLRETIRANCQAVGRRERGEGKQNGPAALRGRHRLLALDVLKKWKKTLENNEKGGVTGKRDEKGTPRPDGDGKKLLAGREGGGGSSHKKKRKVRKRWGFN